VIARIVLWASALVAAYIYIGFPLLLAFLQRFAGRPVAKRAIEPTVSVLVAAYNEAKVIDAKIRNSIALDYPADRIDIAIACDGPKDDTTAIAQRTAASIGEGRVRVFAYPRNRGKLYVLNDTMRELTGEAPTNMRDFVKRHTAEFTQNGQHASSLL